LGGSEGEWALRSLYHYITWLSERGREWGCVPSLCFILAMMLPGGRFLVGPNTKTRILKPYK